MTLAWLLQGLRAARLRHGGDNISLLKAASGQPNCSCRRRKMPGPRNLAGSQLIARPLGCTGVVNPRGEAAEEGHDGQTE